LKASFFFGARPFFVVALNVIALHFQVDGFNGVFLLSCSGMNGLFYQSGEAGHDGK